MNTTATTPKTDHAHPTRHHRLLRRITGQQLKPILEILAQVTWPYPEAKVPTLIDRLGWTWLSDRVDIEADTRLPVNYAVAGFAKPHGGLIRISFLLTDRVSTRDENAAALVKRSHLALATDIQNLWGDPGGSETGEVDRTWWDLATDSRLNLYFYPDEVRVTLLSDVDAEMDRLYQAHPLEEYPELYGD
ncbi:MAG: DUF6301 family protein [Propionibacteriaceae bacterium]|jgi:hypothetical protein|nr:DUF6301 family protein [Propionibacteriaceae bacterium]